MSTLVVFGVLFIVFFVLIITGVIVAAAVIFSLGVSAVAGFIAVMAKILVSGWWLILPAVIFFGFIAYFADQKRKRQRMQHY